MTIDDVDDRQTSGSDQADRGTQLGTSTRVMACLFAFVMLPFTVVGHASRRLWRGMAAVGGSPAGWAAALARPVVAIVRAAGRLVARIAGATSRRWARVLRLRGRVAEWLAASRQRRLCLWGLLGLLILAGLAVFAPDTIVMVVALPLGVAIITAATFAVFGAGYLAVKGTRWLWERIAPPIRAVVAALRRVMRSLVQAFVGVVTPLLLAARQLAGAIGRAVLRALGWLFASVLAPMVRAVARALVAVVTPIGRAVARVLATTAHWALAIAKPVTRGISTVWDRVTLPLRSVCSWCVYRSRRFVYSVGVAFLRARVSATNLPVFAAVTPAHRSTIAPTTVPFEAKAYQNEYLPRGATEVHAIVEVVAHGTPSNNRDAPEAAEVILLDCSGSMGQPWSKLRAARQATAVAIDSLRDGTWFAIVRASHNAEQVYPIGGGLAPASSETRAAAKAALRLLWPEGGTAMGQWLLLAQELFASRPAAIPHAILLTDGKNESETTTALGAALDACSGQFQCDCRGIGTDWNVAELRAISSRLLGTVDIVSDPLELADDFRAMTEAAMAKGVARATLRVWTPQGATLRYVKQVAPQIRDLTSMRTPVDALTGDYPTGSWGNESRQYHVCIELPARRLGEEVLASRISMMVGGRVVSSTLVKATWTDDEQLSTQIDRRVAHFTGQADLAQAVHDGLEARRCGDDETATERFGRAVLLAAESGNEATLHLLRQVVDIEDTASGTVRLKHDVDDADEMALDTRSVKTVPVFR